MTDTPSTPSRQALAERIVGEKESFPDGFPHRGIPIAFRPHEWSVIVQALLSEIAPTRDAVLEEAAKFAEAQSFPFGTDYMNALQIAHGIRALKTNAAPQVTRSKSDEAPTPAAAAPVSPTPNGNADLVKRLRARTRIDADKLIDEAADALERNSGDQQT